MAIYYVLNKKEPSIMGAYFLSITGILRLSIKKPILFRHVRRIDVLISPVFGVKVQYKNTVYETIPYVKPQKTQKPKTEATERKPYIPPDTHYFEYGHNLVKRLTYEDSDRDILKMLEEILLRKYA
ncbi:integrase [Carboxydocella sp. JDF658]|nr:integrase [Carboxydocella sp. JDF658]